MKNFHTKAELAENLSSTLEDLEDTILNKLTFKQAKLLTFWLNDWNKKYLIYESSFDPKTLIKYSKGNIVKLHFGYNIGSEQGGLHYAVVLDKNNSKSSKTLTVIPLRSLKESEAIDDIDERFELFLGEALFIDKLEYVEMKIAEIEEAIRLITPEDPEYTKLINLRDKFNKESTNLRKGSVAIFSQIRTVSKQRISEPIKSYHSLAKYKLDEKTISALDECIKKSYLL